MADINDFVPDTTPAPVPVPQHDDFVPDVAHDDFVPDAPHGRAPLVSAVGASEAAPASGESNMLSDVPHEVYEAGKSALTDINAGLNPWSEENKAAEAKKANAPTFLSGLSAQASDLGRVGKGLMGIPALAVAPITGAARSLIGHPLATAEHTAGTIIAPEIAAKDNPDEMYRTAKEGVDTAMMGLRPAGAPVLRAPPSGLPRGPYEIPPTKPALAWEAPTKPQPPTPPALTPQNRPFGVTLSQGEVEGDLAKRMAEQNAIRSGDPHARAFADQRAAELARSREDLTAQLDPTQQLVESPHAAAEKIIGELQAQSHAEQAATQQRESLLQQYHEGYRNNLSPTHTQLASNPMEAADIVSGSVAASAERAQAAADAAYTAFRELPGQFHPASFNKTADVIKSNLARGDDPTFINPQNTPNANTALGDLTDILGDISQVRDPETGQIIPRPPVTPQLVETARKRLNTSLSNALSSARSTGNWADVRAMRQVIDEFDGQVLKKLDTTFTGGDPRDVSSTLKWARGQYAEYRKTFTPQGAGDVVGPAIQKIVGRQEGQAAAPEEIKSMLYGNGQLPPKIARRLVDMFGVNSPEIGAIKQGLFSSITERPPGATAWGPAQVADRIDAAANSTLTRAYLNPTEIKDLQRYGRALRQHDAVTNAPQDSVGSIISKLTGTDTAEPASLQAAVNRLFKNTLTGESNSVALINELKTRLSPEAFTTFKQGLFQYAVSPGENLEAWGPQKIATNLNKLLNTTGRQGAAAVYSPQERATLQAYANLMGKITMPPGTYFPSAPGINAMMSTVANRIGQVIGALVGRSLTPGLPLISEFAGITIGGKLERALEKLHGGVSKQLPLVTNEMQKWQRAQARAAKNPNWATKQGALLATTSLQNSLRPLGIDFSRLQLPGPGTAQDQQPQQRADGGATDNAPTPPAGPRPFGWPPHLPWDQPSQKGSAQAPIDKRADGGATDDNPDVGSNYVTRRTAPFPEKPEGYEYIEAKGAGADTPGPIATPLSSGLETLAGAVGAPEPSPTPSTLEEAPAGGPADWSTAGFGPSVDTSEGLGSKALNRLTGAGGEERLQTWPEKMVRSGTTLAGDVLSGQEPDLTGLRREDFTDEPRPGGFTVAAEPQDALIQRTQDMAALAGGAGIPNAEEGALGMAGGKLTQPPMEQALSRGMPLFSDTAKPGAALSGLENKLKKVSDAPIQGEYQLNNDPDLRFIADHGKNWKAGELAPGNYLGKEAECHWNVARLFHDGKIDQVVVGYAENADGWHQHTWGLKAGKVVETTRSNTENKNWYGAPLSNAQSTQFSNYVLKPKNSPGKGNVRTTQGSHRILQNAGIVGTPLSANKTRSNQNHIPRPIAQQPHPGQPAQEQNRAHGGRVNPANIKKF